MTARTSAASPLHHRFDGPADAPVLVLSNSLGTDLSMWEPQMPALVRSHRVLRYDTRGHGRSPVTPGPYTMEQLGRDVVDLLDALGLERVRFCGLSLGGMTGIWLGAHAGERFERLALCNTTAYMPPKELWNARIDKVRAGGMAAISTALTERWFTPEFRTRAPDAVQRTQRMLEAIPPEGYVAACAAVRDMDQRDDLAGIAVPTLVIAGSHDLATPPADGRALAQRIPGARCVELAAAHLSNVEQPDRFTAALTDFLA